MVTRKAFNFYKSYYDIYKELSPKDKLEFIDIILTTNFLDKNYNDVNPSNINLKIAYTSIKHSLQASIDGYCNKMNITPCQTPCQPPCQPPCQQEKEKEKEKEEEKVKGKYISPQKKLTSFENYEFYDKDKWIEEANKRYGWDRRTSTEWHDKADSQSNKGGKYIDWLKAVYNWSKKESPQRKEHRL